MTIVQGAMQTALQSVPTSLGPATSTISISAAGPQKLVLAFAGGGGLAPTTHEIALSYP